jgi:hypothetical protein
VPSHHLYPCSVTPHGRHAGEAFALSTIRPASQVVNFAQAAYFWRTDEFARALAGSPGCRILDPEAVARRAVEHPFAPADPALIVNRLAKVTRRSSVGLGLALHRLRISRAAAAMVATEGSGTISIRNSIASPKSHERRTREGATHVVARRMWPHWPCDVSHVRQVKVR